MELINKKFNIWVSSILELTHNSIESYLKLYKDAPLAEFAFTYEKDTGKIVLTKEFLHFKLYAFIVPKYLGADKEKRQNIRNMYSKVIPEDNFDILDMAINERSYRNVKWFFIYA